MDIGVAWYRNFMEGKYVSCCIYPVKCADGALLVSVPMVKESRSVY